MRVLPERTDKMRAECSSDELSAPLFSASRAMPAAIDGLRRRRAAFSRPVPKMPRVAKRFLMPETDAMMQPQIFHYCFRCRARSSFEFAVIFSIYALSFIRGPSFARYLFKRVLIIYRLTSLHTLIYARLSDADYLRACRGAFA